MRLARGLGALGLVGLLLSGCADTREEPDVYVVRPQDTLYSIAWRYDLDFHDLARWNHIGPEYRIFVGQTLNLRGPGGGAAVRSVPPARPSTPPAAPVAPNAATQHTAPVSALKWVWPTERLVVPRPVQGGGILLSGREGQDIRAACAGRVVYSGNGIRGYGNLIIIKHGENLLSAYAHNRETLVKDGQEVAVGQVIGHMGEGAPHTPVLYFEIRRNGKPVDPLAFLPTVK